MHKAAGPGVAVPGGHGGLPGCVGTQCSHQTLPVHPAGHFGAELVLLEPVECAQGAAPYEVVARRGSIGQSGRLGHEGQHAVGQGVLTLQGQGTNSGECPSSATPQSGPRV